MGINTCTMSGNLGSDPEVKYFESGAVMAQFNLAGKIYKNKKNEAVWLTCKVWGGAAEMVGESLKKGSTVTVSGNLDEEKWETQAGEKRSKHVLMVRDIQLPGRDHSPGYDSEPAY